MKGKFSERATPLTISAIRSACSSLSITQGPAMRNRSPEPTRTLSIWKDKVKVVYRRDAERLKTSLASLGMTTPRNGKLKEELLGALCVSAVTPIFVPL